MKRLFKGIQYLMVGLLIGQYYPTVVKAVDSVVEVSEMSQSNTLYAYHYSGKDGDTKEIAAILKELDVTDYKVYKPVKLVSYDGMEERGGTLSRSIESANGCVNKIQSTKAKL